MPLSLRRRPAVSQEFTDLVTTDHATKRWNNDGRGALPPTVMRPFTAPHGIGDGQSTGYQQPNDGLIARDQTPHQHIQKRSSAGMPVNDWAHSGPPRPSLWIRSITITPRSGGKVRWLQNPAAPGTGLHTFVVNDASGALGGANTRMADPAHRGMSSRRQNRLSPARYRGQSYSQTTRIQGGG